MNDYGEIVEFEGVPKYLFYENDDFRMYRFDVDTDKYDDVQRSAKGDVTVCGNTHELNLYEDYIVKARETYSTKYGYSYRIMNIRSKFKPHDPNTMHNFLKELLTYNQAEALFNAYPDIVDKIITDDIADIDLSKLPGIGEVYFEKIKRKIIENYVFADIIDLFGGLFSLKKIKDLYEKYSSIELLKEKLNNTPYGFLTDLKGVAFKKADKILLGLEKNGKITPPESLINSLQRCVAFIAFTLADNEASKGNTRFPLEKLKKKCRDEIPECVIYFTKAIKSKEFFYDEKYISLNKRHKQEVYIAERLYEGLKIKQDYNIDVTPYKNDGKIELSDEQIMGVENACKYTISILEGPGGSGKSASMKAFINILEDNDKSYILLAPTGRASKVLTGYTGRDAQTIHRGLAYNPTNTPPWTYDKDNPLDVDVVIVDEFSMVDVSLFYHLLDAINFENTKLLIVGDGAQLNSVQAGNCLHDMIDSKMIPTTSLTKIFRYSEGGLMKVATDVRHSIPYLKDVKDGPKVTKFGTNEDYIFIQAKDDDIIKNAASIYQKLINDGVPPIDIMVLSAYNKGDYGTIRINKVLQNIANPRSLKGKGLKYGKNTYYIGDIVMQTKNNYTAAIEKNNKATDITCAVYNGELGIIKDIVGNKLIIQFDDRRVIYSNKELKTVLLGYSISIHKSQGSQSPIIILLTPRSHTYMLSSNLLYVGLTRMQRKVYHFGEPYVVDRAVKIKEDTARDTYLKEELKKLEKRDKNH